METNESNTHADPLLGSRWAQMWVHMWAQILVQFLVYVTKGNIKMYTSLWFLKVFLKFHFGTFALYCYKIVIYSPIF